jgi:hypothetical protein
LVAHGQQLGGQGGQVHLIAQAGPEPLDDPGCVVAAPVEAPVDRLLDAAAGGREHRRHRQGRPGHRQAGAAAQEPTQRQHHRGVTSAAANATQRSCWRSTPRARRKRTTTAPSVAALTNASTA